MYSIYAVEGVAIYYNPVFEEDRQFYLCRTVKAISEEEAKRQHKLNIRYEFPYERCEIKEVKITKCKFVTEEGE